MRSEERFSTWRKSSINSSSWPFRPRPDPTRSSVCARGRERKLTAETSFTLSARHTFPIRPHTNVHVAAKSGDGRPHARRTRNLSALKNGYGARGHLLPRLSAPTGVPKERLGKVGKRTMPRKIELTFKLSQNVPAFDNYLTSCPSRTQSQTHTKPRRLTQKAHNPLRPEWRAVWAPSAGVLSLHRLLQPLSACFHFIKSIHSQLRSPVWEPTVSVWSNRISRRYHNVKFMLVIKRLACFVRIRWWTNNRLDD